MIREIVKWASFALILFVLGCITVVAYVDISTAKFIYSNTDVPPKSPVALVLGASVKSNGTLSVVMKERADRAANLYLSGIVSKILVTGDNSTLQYDEVYPVGKYFLALGIPQDDIFLDYAGFDTYSSMYRARDIFGVTHMLIVTQQYHLPRAVFIARTLGLEAYGVDASHGEKYFYNSVREIPASIKAAFDLAINRQPKYLGEQFPVSGTSSTTWLGGETQMIYFKQE
ncbi:YdcF family protein [Patescibacteria group bacterium]|nr:YdcF family protein [Patescibacteria group bacterium]